MSFKNYLDLIKKPSIVFGFGRFNPPHKDHQELFDDMLKTAKKNKIPNITIFTSSVQNSKKNPLNFQDKTQLLKTMVPKSVTVSNDTSLKTPYQILEDLIKTKKYQRIIFVVGEDRIADFKTMYTYVKNWEKELNIDIDFKIEQRKGSRSTGVSATAMRNFAKENDFDHFKELLPDKLKSQAFEIFTKVQQGLK
jgi:nicotinic acid mononucleotide adenylyltransferase